VAGRDAAVGQRATCVVAGRMMVTTSAMLEMAEAALTAEAATLEALAHFVRETPPARTLLEAALLRGLPIERVARDVQGG
jgi:hypothetical protein